MVDADQWQRESFQLAKENVYTGKYLLPIKSQLFNPYLFLDIKESQPLPDSYVQKNQVACEKMLVLGGLRLAQTMVQIFGSNYSVMESEPSQEEAFLQ